KNLPVSLESIKDVVDEMIVVDTGSTDSTVDIAKKYGADIYHFDWCDDFSAARNFALDKAAGEWILYLDADERIDAENGRKIREVIGRADDFMAVSINHHTPQEKDNLIKYFSLDYCRIFRNDKRIRFEGRIHEQILPSINRLNGKVFKSDIIIDHFGYMVSDDKRKERLERNAALLLKSIEEEPNDGFMHFNLAKVYRLMGKYDEAIREFETVLKFPDSDIKERIFAETYTALSQIYLGMDDYVRSRDYALKSTETAPYEILPQYILATIDFIEEKYGDALTKLDKIREIAEDKNKTAVAGEIDRAQVYEDMGNCAVKMSDMDSASEYYKKSIEINPSRYPVHFNLGNVLCAVGNTEDAVKEFEAVLEINKEFEPAKQMLLSLK
ncbi:tetratricopeptide repeat protein, partial [bacterium]|nr:tetratricopeptide repeat protein [bacterium]